MEVSHLECKVERFQTALSQPPVKTISILLIMAVLVKTDFGAQRVKGGATYRYIFHRNTRSQQYPLKLRTVAESELDSMFYFTGTGWGSMLKGYVIAMQHLIKNMIDIYPKQLIESS